MHFSKHPPDTAKNIKQNHIKQNLVYGLTETQGFEEWLKKQSNYFLTNKYSFLFFMFDIYIQGLMTKKKKSPKQQPTEEIQMAGNKGIMIIAGVKMKYLFLKENEYGHNHFFSVLDITPLQDLIELRESLKIQVCG